MAAAATIPEAASRNRLLGGYEAEFQKERKNWIKDFHEWIKKLRRRRRKDEKREGEKSTNDRK